MVVARREREAAVRGDEVVRRLEADDAAPCGRDANRAAGVGSERELDVARRDRCGRAAARAAREPARIRGVRDGSVVRVLRRDAVRELVQVRLPGDRVPGLLEPLDRGRAAVGDVLREERGAVRRHEPRGVEEILDRDGCSVGRLVGSREPDALHGRRLYFFLCFAGFGFGFGAGAITTCRVTGEPATLPPGRHRRQREDVRRTRRAAERGEHALRHREADVVVAAAQ